MRVFYGKCASEPAAAIRLWHFDKLGLADISKQATGLFSDTKAAQQVAGVVVGDAPWKACPQIIYLEHIHDRYSDLKIVEVPMFPYELKGLERLREVERILFQ